MPKKKGAFIVFDGIDGCGKSTAIERARQHLLGSGIKERQILATAEPTKGKFGKEIRKLLAKKEAPEEKAEKLLGLYVKDRKEHLGKVIIPALAQGKIVLCDRYKYATFAYQSAQGISIDEIARLHKGMQVPGLVIVLDLPVKSALARIKDDAQRPHLEKFERAEFLERVRQNFLSLPTLFPAEPIKIVDANRTQAEVFDDVKQLIAVVTSGS